MAHASDGHPAGYHLVMGSFEGTGRAAEAVERLREQGALQGCEIEGEALVSHDAAGRVHHHEKGSAGMGAAAGATAAGLIGLVGGPVVLPLMLVAGALVGGVAGHFMGQVIPQEDLQEVGEALPRESSAYIVLVDRLHAGAVAEAFAAEGARVLNMPIQTELTAAIREAVTHRITRI